MWLCVRHGCSCVQINDTSGWRGWRRLKKRNISMGCYEIFLRSLTRVAFKYTEASQPRKKGQIFSLFLSLSSFRVSSLERIMHESRKMHSISGNLSSFPSRTLSAIAKARTIRNLNLFVFKRRKLITKKKSWHRKERKIWKYIA